MSLWFLIFFCSTRLSLGPVEGVYEAEFDLILLRVPTGLVKGVKKLS